MPKFAVYNPNTGNDLNFNGSELKRLALFFDKIYVSNSVEQSDTIKDIDLVGIEYLEKNDILELYDKRIIMENAIVSEKDQDFITTYNEYILEVQNTGELDTMPLKSLAPIVVTTFLIDDIYSRIDAIELAKKFKADFHPILKIENTYPELGKKSEVIQFMLNNIPEPDKNTPWPALIEFRLDHELRNKRLALINWINEISLTPHSINGIIDKYEYLYSEYVKHLRLHKLKYNYSILEVIVPLGFSILTGEPFNGLKVASDYLKVRLKSVSLLQEESKLPGKEIAYIYHVNKKFN
jgi:hypothetical protein